MLSGTDPSPAVPVPAVNVGRRESSTDCNTCVDLGCCLHVHHAMRSAGVNRHDHTATTPLRHTEHSAGLAGPGPGSTLTTGSAARAGNKPHAHRDVRRMGVCVGWGGGGGTKRCDDSMRGAGHSRDLKLDSGCHCDSCCKLTIPAADFRYQDWKFAVQRSSAGRPDNLQPQKWAKILTHTATKQRYSDNCSVVCVCVCVCVTWECERRSDERSVHKVYWCLHEYVVSETRTSIHTGTASILYVSSSVCYFLWHSIKIFYLRMKNIHCIHDTKGIQTLAFDFAFQCRLLSSHACPE